MIYSMTGYGKGVTTLRESRYEINIKTLNSKQFDLLLHLPSTFRDIEHPLRKLITDRVVRGRIDVTISLLQTSKDIEENLSIFDAEQLKKVMNEVSNLAYSLGCDTSDPLLLRALTLPIVIRSANKETKELPLSKEEIDSIMADVNQALDALDTFRAQEGAMLERTFIDNLDTIQQHALSAASLAPNRIENRRSKLREELNKLSSLNSIEYDTNRFEQELIYYIEKLDVSEELNRLENHIRYFRETLCDSKLPSGCGKKLAFIAQEMGREINTLGAKSNDATMQRIVVEMKDALEQIKEQTANIL